MTTEQYQSIIGRFDGIEGQFKGITQRLDGIDEELKALGTKVEDAKEEVMIFASDIHDRLSNRIERVEVFVGMPKDPTDNNFEEE